MTLGPMASDASAEEALQLGRGGGRGGDRDLVLRAGAAAHAGRVVDTVTRAAVALESPALGGLSI
jgi:hypothetical protein